MDFKFVRFGIRFRGYANFNINFRRVYNVKGVCSNIDRDENGKPLTSEYSRHFLMWDFDGIILRDIEWDLLDLQLKYKLPQIDIIKTTNGFHAYCLKICSWYQCKQIIGASHFVDEKYDGTGRLRGYYTLRVTQVPGEAPFEPISILPSPVSSDMDYNAIQTGVEYSKAVK